HSFIGIDLTQSFIPKENGIQNIFYSWYKPGFRAEELSVTIDTSQFFCITYPASDSGIIQCDLLFPPDWEEKKVWVCFERNFALTSTPGEHPHELRAKEATIIREGKGKITIFLTLPDFFRRWNKTYTRPWRAGDVYPVELSLTLLPPENFTQVTLSDKKDPPFIPNHYEGKVDASKGDPYLFIPSVEPLEEIIIETTIHIPLTDAMIDSL
ncbi:MAG: hypothetical protein JXJ04_11050, partial [Spirochaetales bacterium]|nr:hypothetical protein [Spirochaetales bacterium]